MMPPYTKSAYDGQKTVERIDDEPPDLVVLDIMMPIKDGRDTYRDLKKNPKTKDIKIFGTIRKRN